MDFQEISSPEAQRFIRENAHIPVEELLLGARKFPGLNIPLLVAQIEGKQKAKRKLPSWYEKEIIYPVKLSMEQCSSEITAAYKASLISGDLLIDLTGGFGVDSAAFSEKTAKVFYIEQNDRLADIVQYNFNLLHKNNIEVFHCNAEDFLTTFEGPADWIFIDPARRKEGNKVFQLSDCEPDLLRLKEKLFKISSCIMVKTSPLLDLDIALKELEYIREIHIVAVENECKELLFILDQQTTDPEIIAVNLRKGDKTSTFRFYKKSESETTVQFHMPMDYLYEPNAAILKGGAFKSVARQTGTFKLNSSSHLYTSRELVEDFPGRSFKILKLLKYDKKEILAEIPEGKANITVRNFPDSVELIRKKTGLKDGGQHYLFATRDCQDKPVVLLTEKINP